MIANSITKLQTTVRCWLARKKFLRGRKAAVSVQSWIRGEQVRASVGREMAELVRKRKEKEAQEAEAARIVAEEKAKQLEEQALSVRLAQVGTGEWEGGRKGGLLVRCLGVLVSLGDGLVLSVWWFG